MAQNTLNQSQIDALVAAADRKVEPYDYHVGKSFDSEIVAEISALQKSFATELSHRLSGLMQVPVLVEAQGIDQARFESYMNALPSPTMLGVIGLNPGGYHAVTDIANHLGFAMLDVLLGGSGRPAGFRAFTDLEGILLGEIIDHVGWAIRSAFEKLMVLEPTVVDIQSLPAIGHVSVSSDSVLVQSFRIRVDAAHPQRLLPPPIARSDARKRDHRRPRHGSCRCLRGNGRFDRRGPGPTERQDLWSEANAGRTLATSARGRCCPRQPRR